jgi:hypothetical protein
VVAVQTVTLGKWAEALKLDTMSTLMTSDIIGKNQDTHNTSSVQDMKEQLTSIP